MRYKVNKKGEKKVNKNRTDKKVQDGLERANVEKKYEWRITIK